MPLSLHLPFDRTFSSSLFIAGLVAGCSSLGGDESFEVAVQDQRFVASGVIDGSTPRILRAAFAANPDIRELVLWSVPGSVDDTANLEAGRLVRARGLTTIVPQGGLVASGGTDLFLAGVRREIGPGACLGVHSWVSGLFGGKDGRDLPRDDPEHYDYLDYYAELGVDPAFYWFTLDAASSEEIHWMNNAELQRFGMSTTPINFALEATPATCGGSG